MPALKPTKFEGRVVWLGRVTDQDVNLRSETLCNARLGFKGIDGEMHGGLTRKSCSRTLAQHPRGTDVRNVRQLSILSEEELYEIAFAMEVDALDPALLGASMVIKGIPSFTHVPPSSRLQFPDGSCLVIDMENRPCTYLAKDISKDHADIGPRFKPAAENRRGVTAWVEREGQVSVGDTVRLHIPDQPVWAYYDEARR